MSNVERAILLKLLITRPREDALPLISRLEAEGHRTILEPLLTISHRPEPLPPLDHVSGLIFTSSNGVRAFCHASPRRDLPSYAVGDRTAAELQHRGFQQIATATGDSQALAALIRATVKPENGSLLHIAGTETAGDLAGELREDGYVIARHPLYEATATRRFSASTVAAFLGEKIDGVLLFSPRTARIFVELVQTHRLNQPVGKLAGYCLSPSVAQALRPLGLSRLFTARRPTQDALLELLR